MGDDVLRAQVHAKGAGCRGPWRTTTPSSRARTAEVLATGDMAVVRAAAAAKHMKERKAKMDKAQEEADEAVERAERA